MGTWVEFARLKRAVPLAAVLEQYGIRGLRRSGRDQYRGRCPIHRGEGQDAFQVNLAKQVFHCFSCGAGGTVLDLVAAMERCGLREAGLKLANWFGSPSPASPACGSRPAGSRQLVTEKVTGSPPPLRFTLRDIDHGHRYLQGRGIDEPTARAFGVGLYSGPGLLHGRIVIPIHDEAGQLIGYCGRSQDGTPPRYKFAAGFPKSQVLFNLHRAAACRRTDVVVVEGFFDCLKVHQAGFRSVVALMGAALSDRQMGLLTSRFRQMTLMLDGDETGRQASAVIASRVAAQCSVRVIELAVETQPDQLPAEAIRAALAGKGGDERRTVIR